MTDSSILTDPSDPIAKRPTVLHRKRFMNGEMTPEELHSALAFHPNATCTGCSGRRPIGKITIWAPLIEMMKRSKDVALMANLAPQELLKHVMKFKEAPDDYKGALYVRMGEALSCKSCFSSLEKTAAKAPSWAIVEINRGPGENKIIAGS